MPLKIEISGQHAHIANCPAACPRQPPGRRDNAELGKVSPDRVNHRGLLADKQMARAMKHQTTLLLGRLGRDERILALVTASQIASASAASFFCRLT